MGTQHLAERHANGPLCRFNRKSVAAIRKASLRDIEALLALINGYAAERILLPRSRAELRENIGEFIVAEDEGKVLACGALKIYDEAIAEIRSLCVEPGRKISGLGRAITMRLLREAEDLELKTVFALTVAPEFFWKCGFDEAPRENFPLKIWRDCVLCPKFSDCDEKTMAINLPVASAHPQDVRKETQQALA